MFASDEYALIDCGGGRKLERLGAHVVDRPSPAAEGFPPGDRTLWTSATLRYDRETGQWHGAELPASWIVRHGELAFELRPTEFGHVGLFPEQAANWDWITRAVATSDRPLKLLNLFAYTGGSTLAAAAAGAEVTHIDAARNVVVWARRNAELSGLSDRPVRWIAEDARKFVQRERKRGRRYDGVILDPPSYGHGPSGEAWKIEQHLEPLLADCAELTGGDCRLVLLTCHSPGYEGAVLGRLVRAAFGEGRVVTGELALQSTTGRRLPSGHFARWTPLG